MAQESLGYLGAFIGAIFEGEIAIVASLQATHVVYTNFYGILLAGFLGTISMDWFLYLNGRYNGRNYLNKRPKLQVRLDKMNLYMDRYTNWLLFFYRFMYGFRIALPLLFGLNSIPIRKFAIYSLISTVLWISLLGVLGHYLAAWLGL